MKRILVCIMTLALLITAFPITGFASSVTYTKEDIMTAVSGMGRTPSLYYNAAGIALMSTPSVTSEQAERFTKKLYTVWAFLEQHAYSISSNAAIKDVLTKPQWSAMTTYLSDLLYEYGSATVQTVISVLSTARTSMLKKSSVPQSLLGIQFDNAITGVPTTVKVYTSPAIASGITITDANGRAISTGSTTSTYAGTLATFKEHLVNVTYPYAGRITLRVYGVDSKFPKNYYTAVAYVNNPPISRDTGTSTVPSVQKLTAGSAPLGTPNEIKVTTNAAAVHAIITDKKGIPLAVSSTPTSTTTTSKTFTFNYSFSSVGKHTIRAYAGIGSGSNILWSKKHKTANVTVTSPAASATISKVQQTSPFPFRGHKAFVKVYTSSNVTRVRLFNASNDVVAFADTSATSGKNRVFSLEYQENAAGSFKVYAQAGNAIDWNSARKSAIIKFYAPYASSVTTTSALRGTAATIKVTGSPTATSARLLSSTLVELGTATPGLDGKFTFTRVENSAGNKRFYVQVNDGLGWSTKKAVTVTYKLPTITSFTYTRVPAGTNSTITVGVPSTVTKVELNDGGKKIIETKDVPAGKTSVDFLWGANQTKGKKTIYLRIFDGIGWSGYFKSSVTFN
jgi:hypothetical protein